MPLKSHCPYKVGAVTKETGLSVWRSRIFGVFALMSVVAMPGLDVHATDETQEVPTSDSTAASDWSALGKAWEKYLEYPSTENAGRVYVVIPAGGTSVPNDAYASAIIDSVYMNLSMLERQMYSGDRNAVRVAFRFLRISDGAFGEWLSIILGAMIRINPRLFLEEFKVHRDEVVRLDALVGNLGNEFVDNVSGQNLEVELRIKALESITDEALAGVRDECVNELRQQIREER